MLISSAISTNRAGSIIDRKPGFEFWSVGLFIKGAQKLRICGDSVEMRRNHILIVPSETPYRFEALRESQNIWAIFRPEERVLLSLREITEEKGYGVFELNSSLTYSKGIMQAIREMAEWWATPLPSYELAENALEKALLLLSRSIQRKAETDRDKRIDKAIVCIHLDYAQPISVTSLAREASMSVSRFAHLFKEREGLSPASYIEQYRMERARELLLSTDHSITEIAFATGFTNQFHFSARFKKILGQSPRSFRNQPVRDHHSIIPSRRRKHR